MCSTTNTGEKKATKRRTGSSTSSSAGVGAGGSAGAAQTKHTSQRPNRKRKASESDLKSKITLIEKSQLHETLTQLGDNEWAMERVMDIIAPKRNPIGSGELEIDVANLPPPTIRKLQRFVRNVNNNNLSTKGVDALGIDSNDEDDDNDSDYQ